MPLEGPTRHPYAQDERFRKEERLLKRYEFLRAQNEGGRFTTTHLIVYARPGEQPWSRVGLTASRKVGDAVTRNRRKRLLREVFRRNKGQLPLGCDLVWIVRPGAPDAPLEEWARQAIEASARALRKAEARARDRSAQAGKPSAHEPKRPKPDDEPQ